jgi:hypothetical protein
MMLEELERRNYSQGTTRRYLRFVERFAQHFGKSPDTLGPDHLRSYQAYLLRLLGNKESSSPDFGDGGVLSLWKPAVPG